eukprot:9027076-Lingulodinium_polyedra.AAC.1
MTRGVVLDDTTGRSGSGVPRTTSGSALDLVTTKIFRRSGSSVESARQAWAPRRSIPSSTPSMSQLGPGRRRYALRRPATARPMRQATKAPRAHAHSA